MDSKTNISNDEIDDKQNPEVTVKKIVQDIPEQ